MRVLIVARQKEGKYATFIIEQVDAIQRLGIDCRFFPIKRNGGLGYLSHLNALNKAIKEFKPDLIHAHYGLCGLLSNAQRRVPVITTYHGSDINSPKIRPLSRLAMHLSAYNVFVSQRCIDLMNPKKHYALIPCGVNLNDYPTISKTKARRMMGLLQNQTYVLFSGAFDNPVKNVALAKKAIEQLPGYILLELKGYSRKEVAALLQAVDALLMTSNSEGSPQVIKEALACGCPIVSVDVGDVGERIKGIEGCFLSASDCDELSSCLSRAIEMDHRVLGREKLIDDHLDNSQVAKRLELIYNSVIQ